MPRARNRNHHPRAGSPGFLEQSDSIPLNYHDDEERAQDSPRYDHDVDQWGLDDNWAAFAPEQQHRRAPNDRNWAPPVEGRRSLQRRHPRAGVDAVHESEAARPSSRITRGRRGRGGGGVGDRSYDRDSGHWGVADDGTINWMDGPPDPALSIYEAATLQPTNTSSSRGRRGRGRGGAVSNPRGDGSEWAEAYVYDGPFAVGPTRAASARTNTRQHASPNAWNTPSLLQSPRSRPNRPRMLDGYLEAPVRDDDAWVWGADRWSTASQPSSIRSPSGQAPPRNSSIRARRAVFSPMGHSNYASNGSSPAPSRDASTRRNSTTSRGGGYQGGRGGRGRGRPTTAATTRRRSPAFMETIDPDDIHIHWADGNDWDEDGREASTRRNSTTSRGGGHRGGRGGRGRDRPETAPAAAARRRSPDVRIPGNEYTRRRSADSIDTIESNQGRIRWAAENDWADGINERGSNAATAASSPAPPPGSPGRAARAPQAREGFGQSRGTGRRDGGRNNRNGGGRGRGRVHGPSPDPWTPDSDPDVYPRRPRNENAMWEQPLHVWRSINDELQALDAENEPDFDGWLHEDGVDADFAPSVWEARRRLQEEAGIWPPPQRDAQPAAQLSRNQRRRRARAAARQRDQQREEENMSIWAHLVGIEDFEGLELHVDDFHSWNDDVGRDTPRMDPFRMRHGSPTFARRFTNERVVESEAAKAERLKNAREVDYQKDTIAMRYTRACGICTTPNPRIRFALVVCGHILCAPCVESVDCAYTNHVYCPYCRRVTAFVRLFETLEEEATSSAAAEAAAEPEVFQEA